MPHGKQVVSVSGSTSDNTLVLGGIRLVKSIKVCYVVFSFQLFVFFFYCHDVVSDELSLGLPVLHLFILDSFPLEITIFTFRP